MISTFEFIEYYINHTAIYTESMRNIVLDYWEKCVRIILEKIFQMSVSMRLL